MSGPKVVTIVSREEIEAVCHGHLREVARAVELLTTTARRHGALDAGLERELGDRTRAFEAMLREERWMDIQKTAPQVAGFLKAEAVRHAAAAVSAAVRDRTERRRTVDAARGVAAALASAGLAVPADLVAVAGGAGPDAVAMRTAVERALSSLRLAKKAPATPSTETRALGDRLTQGEGASSMDAWLAARPARPDPSVARLDAALAELETIVGPDAATPLAARAAALAAENEASRRALLADSIVLEAGSLVAASRAIETARERLAAVLEEAEAMSAPGLAATVSALKGAGQGEDTSVLDELAARAEAAVAAEAAARAAAARRRAVLSGLAELGYEVRQSMATSLAENGRVVLRKPSESDYGIELAAPGAGTRMQVRLVGAARPATPRTKQRDKDKETVWCGDVDRLKAAIRSAGGDFVIERGVGVGVEDVRTVALDGPAVETDRGDTVPAAAALR